MSITAHAILKNEENFIWFAINSVLSYVDRIIIFDTGSTDKTVEIIKSIKNPKIKFEEKGEVTPQELVNLRNEQIEKTKTDWFMLLDGDEVWPEESIKKLINAPVLDKIAVVVRSRNCVGDIFHFQKESKGEYRLLGMKGHFNIRLYKKTPDFRWVGNYPLEAYSDKNGPINNQDEKLQFVDTYYWHLTHLKRSSVDDKKKRKLELGIKADKTEVPEIFFAQRPEIVPDPFLKPSIKEKLLATILTPIKDIKYRI